ncbi:O-antigen ligase family protein, partial [Luminiphilus sp.]|nr:O-antigen ligase family protein [Luminiphilus sp.]
AWSFFSGAFIVGSSMVRVKRFFSLIVILGLIFSADAMLLLSAEDYSGDVMMGLTNDYIITSIMISTSLLLITVHHVITVKKSNIRNIILGLVQLYLLFMVLTLGAKGPLIALIIAYSVLFSYAYSLKNTTISTTKSTKSKIYFYLIFFISSIFLIDNEQFISIERLVYFVVNFSNQSDLGGRVWLNFIALNMWMEDPIMGKGIGSFGVYVYDQDFKAYSHNIFTETMAELGLIGLLLLVFIFYIPLRLVPRSDNIMFIIPYVGFIFYLVTVQFSGSLPDHKILFTLIGIISASSVYLPRSNLIRKVK